jgi:hypothetical protein
MLNGLLIPAIDTAEKPSKRRKGDPPRDYRLVGSVDIPDRFAV